MFEDNDAAKPNVEITIVKFNPKRLPRWYNVKLASLDKINFKSTRPNLYVVKRQGEIADTVHQLRNINWSPITLSHQDHESFTKESSQTAVEFFYQVI